MNRHVLTRLLFAAPTFVVLAASCAAPGAALRESPPATIARHLDAEAASSEPESQRSERPTTDGSVASYVSVALENQPGLEAHAERWRAATLNADAAGAWPRLKLSYAFLPMPVETRLGPQRHRVGIQQGLPWPGQIEAASRAAAANASVEEARLLATANEIREEVELAFWDLWLARQTGQVLSEQVTILETSARIARGAIEVGQEGLSSVARIELAAARLRDRQSANTARAAAAEARLRGALGVDLPQLPTTPTAFSPVKLDDDVSGAPELEILRRQVDAAVASAEAADASARPTFSVGLDYIFVNQGNVQNDDAGRDALMVMLGIALPTSPAAELARGRAARATERATTYELADRTIDRDARAKTLIELARDAQRRHDYYRDTLLPQAETAFEASLGDYEAGRVGVADLLLAQREWLGLSIGAAEARAEYEITISRLARIRGEALQASGAGDD